MSGEKGPEYGKWSASPKHSSVAADEEASSRNQTEVVPPLFAERLVRAGDIKSYTSSTFGQWLHPEMRTLLTHAFKQLEDHVKYYWNQGWNLLTSGINLNNLLTIGVVVVLAVFLSQDGYYQSYLKEFFLYYFSGVVHVESMKFSDIALAMVVLLCLFFLIICLLSTCLSGSFPGQNVFSGTYSYSMIGPSHMEGRPLEDGSCGIDNLGNSCYMSSTLQCLSHIPEVTIYFLSGAYKQDLNRENAMGSNGRMATAYAELLEALWSNRYYSISPVQFQDEFISLRPQFERRVQQDAQEFLGALLDGLHEDLNQCGLQQTNGDQNGKEGKRNRQDPCDQTNSDDDTPRRRASTGTIASQVDKMSFQALEERSKTSRSIISDKFYGQLCCKTRCPRCEHNSIKFDSFSVLTLPLPEPLYILRNRVILPVTTNFDVDDPKLLELFLKVRLEDSLSQCQRLITALCGLSESYTIDTWIVEKGIPVEKLEPRELVKDYATFQPHIVHQVRPKKATAEHTKILQKHYFLYKESTAPGTEETLKVKYVYTGIPYIFCLQEDTRASEVFQTALAYAKSVWSTHCLKMGMEVPFDSVSPKIKLLSDLNNQSKATLMGNERIIPKNPKDSRRNKAPFVVIEWGHELLHSDDVSQMKHATENTLVHPLLHMMSFKPNADLLIHSPTDTQWDVGLSFAFDDVVEKGVNAHSIENPGKCIGDDFLVELRLFDRNSFGPHQIATTNLHHCLANFQSEEELSADNTYTCEYCRFPVMARRSLLLWSTPDVLIVLLKRFICVDDYGTISKDNMVVEYPLKDLDLTEWIEGGADRKLREVRSQKQRPNASNASAKYDLCGVVMHTGSLTRGHYTAYVENPLSGSWHFYNDHMVERVASPSSESATEEKPPGVDLEKLESILHTDAAYVLVYQRQGSVGKEVDKLRGFLKRDPERLVSMHPEYTGIK